MTTVLLYLVIAAAIGLVVFAIAVLIFGRGEQMAALSPRVSPAELPDEEITPEDIRKVRFALALRGYRMSDVDWTLSRLSEEIARLRTELGLDPAPPAPTDQHQELLHPQDRQPEPEGDRAARPVEEASPDPDAQPIPETEPNTAAESGAVQQEPDGEPSVAP